MLSTKKLIYKIIDALSPTSVGTATRTTAATGGDICYIKFFKIVLVSVTDLSVNTNTHGTILATGLPKRNTFIPRAVLNTTAAASVGWRVAVDGSGNLVNHYPVGASTVNQCSGTFWYLSA